MALAPSALSNLESALSLFDQVSHNARAAKVLVGAGSVYTSFYKSNAWASTSALRRWKKRCAAQFGHIFRVARDIDDSDELFKKRTTSFFKVLFFL